jgi:DNA-binding CsgD family transcriptional regulator
VPSNATSTSPSTAYGDFADFDSEEPLLTWRQVQVLKWAQEGKSSWEIGAIIGISGRTVEGHLRKIYARLDVHTRLHAVLRAHELGLLPRRPVRG